MTNLLYGAGLQLMECVRLRVKDVAVALQHIIVRDEQSGQDRVTILPRSVEAVLQRHLAKVKLLHEEDLLEGGGDVDVPSALAYKHPHAGTSWE